MKKLVVLLGLMLSGCAVYADGTVAPYYGPTYVAPVPIPVPCCGYYGYPHYHPYYVHPYHPYYHWHR